MPIIRTLVVDDSQTVRLMVMRGLNRLGNYEFDFWEAQDGVEGLESFLEHRPDCVFIDWKMPRMSGIDLIRQIRSMDNTSHVMLVMVSGEKNIAKIDEALTDAGANAYICKPFTDEQLSSKIDGLIQEIVKRNSKSKSFFARLLQQ